MWMWAHGVLSLNLSKIVVMLRSCDILFMPVLICFKFWFKRTFIKHSVDWNKRVYAWIEKLKFSPDIYLEKTHISCPSLLWYIIAMFCDLSLLLWRWWCPFIVNLDIHVILSIIWIHVIDLIFLTSWNPYPIGLVNVVEI